MTLSTYLRAEVPCQIHVLNPSPRESILYCSALPLASGVSLVGHLKPYLRAVPVHDCIHDSLLSKNSVLLLLTVQLDSTRLARSLQRAAVRRRK